MVVFPDWLSRLGGPLLLCVLLAHEGRADSLQIAASADTTLIEGAAFNNLGGAEFFNAGSNGGGSRNRALMLFNFAGIPANATITSVDLSLVVIRQPTESPTSSAFSLFRVLRPWGEGTKTHDGTPDQPISPGLGNPATAGEATWNERMQGIAPWAAPGGAIGIDFSAGISGEADIGGGGTGDYRFEFQPGMVADVQYWLEHPESNFGWMLLTESESTRHTARSFASHEDPYGQGPLLNVTFEVVPEPSAIVIVGIASIMVCASVRCRRLTRASLRE
jgi:hypothetical protein